MNASITNYHESSTCVWCQKQTEAVTVSFQSGFLSEAAMCFKCLQQAIRVHHKQETHKQMPAKPNKNE